MPGVLALLPEYAGQEDPVPEVRAAALAAAAWLAEAGPVTVVGDEQGGRVGRHLLEGAAEGDGSAYLVVANGSARRNDTAPGYVDERAVPFDAAVEAALRGPTPRRSRAWRSISRPRCWSGTRPAWCGWGPCCVAPGRR